MTTRLVRAPSAPSQASEFGACPSVCFHGWKWSLTKTESNPTSSARHEKSSNSRGPNCSADALYPSFSKGSSSVTSPPGSSRGSTWVPGTGPGTTISPLRFCAAKSSLYFRQYILAEAPHIGEHRFGSGAFEIEIDIANAEVPKCAQIGDDIGHLTGEQSTFAVICAGRQRLAPARDAVGETHFRRIPPGLSGQSPQALDPGLEPLHRVEPMLRVRADRVPGVTDPGSAAQRRTAL